MMILRSLFLVLFLVHCLMLLLSMGKREEILAKLGKRLLGLAFLYFLIVLLLNGLAS